VGGVLASNSISVPYTALSFCQPPDCRVQVLPVSDRLCLLTLTVLLGCASPCRFLKSTDVTGSAKAGLNNKKAAVASSRKPLNFHTYFKWVYVQNVMVHLEVQCTQPQITSYICKAAAMTGYWYI
jgi:hypothetical protein